MSLSRGCLTNTVAVRAIGVSICGRFSMSVFGATAGLISQLSSLVSSGPTQRGKSPFLTQRLSRSSDNSGLKVFQPRIKLNAGTARGQEVGLPPLVCFSTTLFDGIVDGLRNHFR